MPDPIAADPTLEDNLGDGDGDPNAAGDGQDPNNQEDPTGDQPDDLQVQLDKANVSLSDVQAELAKVTKESNEWLSRFTGMQGKYQQEKKKWDDASGDLSGLPTQLSDLQTQMDTLQTKFDDGQIQISALQAEKDFANQSLERKNIIFKEFPGLISFEGDGLLPEGVGEDLRTKLTAFNDKMTKLGGDQFETLLSGSSPAKPNASDESAQGSFDEAKKAFRSGDTEAYNTLYGKHLQQLDNGKE